MFRGFFSQLGFRAEQADFKLSKATWSNQMEALQADARGQAGGGGGRVWRQQNMSLKSNGSGLDAKFFRHSSPVAVRLLAAASQIHSGGNFSFFREATHARFGSVNSNRPPTHALQLQLSFGLTSVHVSREWSRGSLVGGKCVSEQRVGFSLRGLPFQRWRSFWGASSPSWGHTACVWVCSCLYLD